MSSYYSFDEEELMKQITDNKYEQAVLNDMVSRTKTLSTQDLYTSLCKLYDTYHVVDTYIEAEKMAGKSDKFLQKFIDYFYALADVMNCISDEIHGRGHRCICPDCGKSVSVLN